MTQTVINMWPARLAKANAEALRAKEERLQRAWQAHRGTKARTMRAPAGATQTWMTADGAPPMAWREVANEARRLDVHTFFYVNAGEKMFSATARPGEFHYADTVDRALKAIKYAAASRGAK